jgi:hypothetical protein
VDRSSVTTRMRLENADWWPTNGEPPRNRFVGNGSCKSCHEAMAELQQTTPMFHAGVRAGQSEIIQKHRDLNFQEPGFHYSLKRTPEGAVTYSVSHGTESNTTDAIWAFGAGEVGQTYILEQNAAYIESRLSYFPSLGALDITVGHSDKPPAGVQQALGNRLDASTARRCFGCHTTAATASQRFEPEKATPGVQCEACHGPGARHVAAMSAGEEDRSSATIMNPAHLSSADSVDFCGACHRTSADVAAEMPANIGLASLRFQPYRLEESRCWKESGDARITCIGCHNPHRPLVREASAYDSKCLACHSEKPEPLGQNGAKTACKVGTDKCVSCHMQKYEVPGTHAKFTDHFIRIVSFAGRKGAAIPQ